MPPSPERISSPLPPVAGIKKRAASLLPAFDPLSSSPALPRPLKRSRDAFDDRKDYPTPVPSSSTAILSSSPSRIHARPPPQRSVSALSERAPLSDVRSITLSEDGTAVLMGRSSLSCHFQLAANRMISRIHVKAQYKRAALGLSKERIEIHCEGWNGAKVSCLGRTEFLHKDDVFISEERHADIMVDVHDARVLIRWPSRKAGTDSTDTISTWGDENSPGNSISPTRRRSFAGSPLRQRQRIASPISPSPAVQALAPSSPPLIPPPSSPPPVEIYEDEEAVEAEEATASHVATTQQSTQKLTQPFSQADLNSQPPLASQEKEPLSLQSSLTEPPEDFSDHDEENDPIVHSFGPFGANILNNMASFKTYDSPRPSPRGKASASHFAPHSPVRQHALKTPLDQVIPSSSPVRSPRSKEVLSQVRSHIINQLAFSRLSSTPLSTIISHLPNEETYKRREIRELIAGIKCIGEIMREGKDAAGKPLESEFYYIPEEDEDGMRKDAVVSDLGRTGLRACRKQHKVCDSDWYVLV